MRVVGQEMNDELTDSWSAVMQGGALLVRGKARFPNDFSTASLTRRQYSIADGDTLTFDLVFNRDKEPFCGPDLIGEVTHFERNLPNDVLKVRVIVGGETEVRVPIQK